MNEHPPIELRKAGAVLGVRFEEREIDLIAVPYDEEAVVEHRGRLVRETVRAGAFDGIEARGEREGRKGNVKVNMAHELERVVGRAIRFDPRNDRGLLATLRISRTAAGDDALELAADELVGASIGFYPLPGGEAYSADRSRRTITRAYLDHVALTADPAYAGAQVLAVRASGKSGESESSPQRTPTPRLDEILLERRLASMLDTPSSST